MARPGRAVSAGTVRADAGEQVMAVRDVVSADKPDPARVEFAVR